MQREVDAPKEMFALKSLGNVYLTVYMTREWNVGVGGVGSLNNRNWSVKREYGTFLCKETSRNVFFFQFGYLLLYPEACKNMDFLLQTDEI